MSGPIVDMPVRVCRACKATFLEDDRMYEEPERCPRCGSYPADARTGEDVNDDDYGGEPYG